jgi:hypothetical protein
MLRPNARDLSTPGSAGDLRPELTEMMVGVEIAQAHPFSVRQSAELRVRPTAGVSGLIRKTL